VIPKTTFKLMVFEFDGPDRINWQGQDCVLTRVGAAAGPGQATGAAGQAAAGAAGGAVLSVAISYGSGAAATRTNAVTLDASNAFVPR
jgi:hypothetical protein